MWRVSTLLLVLQASQSVNADCVSGYYHVKENGNCYRVSEANGLTAKEVITSCETEQAYLPVIRNPFDNAMVRGFAKVNWPILLGFKKVGAVWKWDYPGEQSVWTNWAGADEPKADGTNAYMRADGKWITTAPAENLKTTMCQTENSINQCTPAGVTDAYYIYNSVDKKCYWFTRKAGAEEPSNQATASSFCKAKGGALPAKITEEGNAFLANLYPADFDSKLDGGPRGWIGLKFVNQKFVWEDGTQLDSSKDFSNFAIIDHTQGECVSISYAAATLGEWQMTNCADTMFLTCQTGLPIVAATTAQERLNNPVDPSVNFIYSRN